jgi:DHA2 family multidrug resistance protein-like MFS transporter
LAAVAVLSMIGVLFTMPQYFQGVLGADAIGRYLPAVTATPWALISVITGGRLLLPEPSG